MKLPYHNRYSYSPIVQRPDFSWPEGKRLAFYVALNVEHFIFGGSGHFPVAAGHAPDHKNYAWREYGVRVGIWRILDLLDELKLPAAHLVNSECFDRYPQIFDRIRGRGDEIVGHGRTNSERQGILLEDDERQLVLEATNALARAQGKPPQGWMGPWISESNVTVDILKEAGYSYCMDWPCDDQPVWLSTRSGPILSVPYPIELNDAPSQLNRQDSPALFAEMVIDQFEEMLEQSRANPLVMGVSLHTFIMGQPFRMRHLRRALQHIARHAEAGRVWFTTPGEIARHAMALPEGTIA